MKNLVLVLACCCLLMRASGSEPSSTVAKDFVGVWKLVRIEVRHPDGHITPDPDLGPHVVGYIAYDSTGHMGVQLMDSDRPKWKSKDQPTAEESRAAVTGFEAYSGTYEVHGREGYVIHHAELSLDPNSVGEAKKRKFQLTGGQLSLTPPPFKSSTGEMLDETLIWERVR